METELEEELADVQELNDRLLREMGELELELARVTKPISILRVPPPTQKYFAPDDVTVWALPRKGFMRFNTIRKGCVFSILEAANPDESGDESPGWFYVEVPWVGDSPVNMRGWVRADQTVPYTDELRSKVRCPVGIPETTTVYEVEWPGEISAATAQEAGRHLEGLIKANQDTYTQVNVGGGQSLWVKTADLVFPGTE